jgi:hypothetical protein
MGDVGYLGEGGAQRLASFVTRLGKEGRSMTRLIVAAILTLGALASAALAQDPPRQVLRTIGPSEMQQIPHPANIYAPPRYPPRHWNPTGGFDSQIHSYGSGINVSSPMPHASVPSW